ncbi:DUF1830 domain-containing protein [Chlorogloeopsis fritschii PCC 9212]|jgi:hypothetical protein|uniref:Uncharacterized protein n=1 Tax=Chlorogloeopsis fritschii PCC 6912 TaxID=211165 RepID=A0A433MWI9_CHLFR|nr:DUF1830 domain-containing protein [Chlorogloeopsis fritschii]RUR72357.1 hypothetical protein PCC6912_63350 [Chlorogloeopsis fritschii PCC 6912]
MKLKQIYYGWLIELTPLPTGYLFNCWMPGEKTGFSDRQIYPTFVQALMAGKRRADLETVSLSLIHFLNQSYKLCNLSLPEYQALEKSVFDFVKQASRTDMDMPDTSTLKQANQILCFYKNTTSQIQIARISNFSNNKFEQVVFPGEQVLFEASPEAELEIHMGDTTGTVLANKILCSNLKVL